MAELTPIFEQMPSEVLIRFADQHNMITTNLKDCLYAESGNQGYALNYLSAGLKPMVAEQEKLKPWAGIQGTALFRHHKLVATLPMKESLAVSWAVNEVKGPLYTVSWKEGEGKRVYHHIKLQEVRSHGFGPSGIYGKTIRNG